VKGKPKAGTSWQPYIAPYICNSGIESHNTYCQEASNGTDINRKGDIHGNDKFREP
jgi:hypothetical protein